MRAIHLKDYVKSLSEICPTEVPNPTFSSYLSTTKAKKPSEPLVHIKITHTAINHVDLLYAHGVHQNNKSGLFKPPFTLGLEFSGVIINTYSLPDLPCSFKVGDKVWGGAIGSHAEEIIVPEGVVRHLPGTGWGLRDMAALGAATIPVSYGALTLIGDVRPGETVLIHAAAGGLGVYAVQIARALGAKVIGTVGSEHKIAAVEELLRDKSSRSIPPSEGVVNYSKDGWEKEVLSICRKDGKDGVDVVIDTVGLVQKSIKCTAFNGRVVVVGFAARTGTGAEKVEELEQIAVNKILLKQIKLLGYRFGETSRRLPEETRKMWDGLNQMLAREPTLIKPVVYKTYRGLEAVPEAMQALSERKVFGKAVIEICSEQDVGKLAKISKHSRGKTDIKL